MKKVLFKISIFAYFRSFRTARGYFSVKCQFDSSRNWFTRSLHEKTRQNALSYPTLVTRHSTHIKVFVQLLF